MIAFFWAKKKEKKKDFLTIFANYWILLFFGVFFGFFGDFFGFSGFLFKLLSLLLKITKNGLKWATTA